MICIFTRGDLCTQNIVCPAVRAVNTIQFECLTLNSNPALHCSVRPKPPFWFRPNTETETQYLAVTFGDTETNRNYTILNWKALYFYMSCQLPKHLFGILLISIMSINYKFTKFEVIEIKKISERK
jgi:hypothetical protein